MKKIVITFFLISLIGITFLVTASMSVSTVSVQDRYADRGIQRYDVELDIVRGWNLVSSFYSPEQLSSSSFAKENIRAIYGFVPTTQEYIQIYPDKYNDLTSELSQKHNIDDEELVMGSFWVYSNKEGILEYTSDLMLPIDEIPLYSGWNFVSITPELVEVLVNKNFGSCDIDKAYFWDIANNQWLKFPISNAAQFTWDGDDVKGYGLVIKVLNDCKLGVSGGIAPPILPGNDNDKDLNINPETLVVEQDIGNMKYIRTEDDGGEAVLLKNSRTNNQVNKELSSFPIYSGIYKKNIYFPEGNTGWTDNRIYVMVQNYKEKISVGELEIFLEARVLHGSYTKKDLNGESVYDMTSPDSDSIAYIWKSSNNLIYIFPGSSVYSKDDIIVLAEYYLKVYPTVIKSLICTESDDGADYNTKGESCLDGECYSDYCESNILLREFACDNRYEGGDIDFKDYECQNGCKDGICI